jgi:hypothetical protein
MNARTDVELEALRHEVAVRRGVGADAASFLTGSTLSEIEASADALVELLGANSDQREPDSTTGTDLFTGIAEAKAARKHALAAVLCGRPQQPRDELGRYARRGGFDGGARQTVPVAQSPAAAHAELLGHLFAASRTYRGVGFDVSTD